MDTRLKWLVITSIVALIWISLNPLVISEIITKFGNNTWSSKAIEITQFLGYILGSLILFLLGSVLTRNELKQK